MKYMKLGALLLGLCVSGVVLGTGKVKVVNKGSDPVAYRVTNTNNDEKCQDAEAPADGRKECSVAGEGMKKIRLWRYPSSYDSATGTTTISDTKQELSYDITKDQVGYWFFRVDDTGISAMAHGKDEDVAVSIPDNDTVAW